MPPQLTEYTRLSREVLVRYFQEYIFKLFLLFALPLFYCYLAVCSKWHFLQWHVVGINNASSSYSVALFTFEPVGQGQPSLAKQLSPCSFTKIGGLVENSSIVLAVPEDVLWPRPLLHTNSSGWDSTCFNTHFTIDTIRAYALMNTGANWSKGISL